MLEVIKALVEVVEGEEVEDGDGLILLKLGQRVDDTLGDS